MEDKLEQQEQQNNDNKVEKQFNSAMQKLTALLNGDKTLLTTSKVPNSSISSIVDRLTKARRDKAEEEFEKEATVVFDEVISFNKFTKQKEAEFKKAVDEKKKELTSKVNNLIGKLESVGDLMKAYSEIMSTKNVETESSEEEKNN